MPTQGQAEISTFHLPAHFVSQDPKEVGADEVGYAGRKEGHPWEREGIKKVCVILQEIRGIGENLQKLSLH